MWYRVFGMSEVELQPAEILENLQDSGLTVKGHFRGDDQGWYQGEFVIDDLTQTLDRYLAYEKDVRGELNTWAAWVETQEDYPRRDDLMQQIIGTRQLFLMKIADDESADSPLHQLCAALSQFMAAKTRGFYQVDGRGILSAEGELMLGE